jgi:hypothetical protein
MHTPAFGARYSEPGKALNEYRKQEWKLVVKATSSISPLKAVAQISHLSPNLSVCLSQYRNAGNIAFDSYFQGWRNRPRSVFTESVRDAVVQLVEGKCDLAIVTEGYLREMGAARSALREITPLPHCLAPQAALSGLVMADGNAETFVPDQSMDCSA